MFNMRELPQIYLALAFIAPGILAAQKPFETGHDQKDATWLDKYGPQFDLPFTGPLAFSHLPYKRCLEDETSLFDIAIIGMPFDTAVTYRNGARFGPYAIRSGSRRQDQSRGYTVSWGGSPYRDDTTILDCGDVPVSPFDNALAIDQIEVAYSTLLRRSPPASDSSQAIQTFPRIVSLGGDHTIVMVLPILRSLHKVYGPVTVIHFDAHLDSWMPGARYPSQVTEQSRITHGTFFYVAYEEGLIANNSIHAGIRCKMEGVADLENDRAVGFQLISADDIDDIGPVEITRRIKERVGNAPVYLSLDIDVLDPGTAPGTGTPEAGGWTTRELKRIIRGLAGLNFVGADIVEVSPAYDNAEVTAIAAADLVHDMLNLLQSARPELRMQPAPRDEL